MKIEVIELENFWSYKKEALHFDYTTPVLVTGEVKGGTARTSNGAGKSALFEAVVYGLFGKTTKGVSADAVINTQVKKNCRVAIGGICDSGNFNIARFRNHHSHENQLHFTINKTPCNGPDNRATQKLIEKILGVKYETFISTIYFNSQTASGFCSLTDGAQKSIFDNILDLERWDGAHQAAGVQLTQAKANLATLEAEIGAYDTTKKSLILDLKKYRDLHAPKIKKQQKILRNKRRILQKLNDQLTESCTKLRSFSHAKQFRPDSLRLQIKMYEAEVEEITRAITIKEQEVLATKDAFARVHQGNCDTCGQRLPQINTEYINQLNRGLQQSELDLLDLQDMKYVSERNKNGTEEILNVVEKEISERNEIINKITNLGRASSLVFAQIGIYKANLYDRRSAISNTSNAILERRSQCKILQDQMPVLAQVRTACGPKGVRALMIKTILPMINDSLAKYSNVMMGGEIGAQFKLEKDRLELDVKKTGGNGNKSCSAGEARRIDICMLFALLDLVASLGRKTNFIILDEIFDHLDSLGLEKAMGLLYNVDYNNIFVVSHSPELKEYFQEGILITSTNGESKISVGG